MQEAFDDLALASRRGKNFGHGLAELDPIIRPEAFDRRMRRRDAEFLLVRGEPPVQRHRASLVLDQETRLVPGDLMQPFDDGAQGRVILGLAEIEIVADPVFQTVQPRAVEARGS